MKLQSTLKALATALQPLPNRSLRSSVAAALILHFTLYTLHSPAAEPLCWERTPNRPAPAQFDTFHGESLDFRCTFTGFGALPFAGASDVRLWYQTNGMGAAWWSIPATVSSNMLAATFPPSADPGAERLTVFFGAPSNAYAAAQVRFRNSPGATPNDLNPPSVLDWQAELAAATNDLFKSFAPTITNTYTKAETDARIAELAPSTSLAPATNYTDEAVAAVSNAVALKADKTRAVLVPTYYTAPSVFYPGNWCFDLVEGRDIGDIEYDATLTRACADGRVYWQGTASYQIDDGEGTFYAMVIVRLGVDGGGEIYDVGSAVNIIDYARISTPEALDDAINWNGALTKTEYDFMYEDSYAVAVGGDTQLAAYDSGTESVVYDLDLTNAINGIASQIDGKLSTTGGVVTGNIILLQTGGSGSKTTINGHGITAGIEGFTIDSGAATLALKGSSATLNFPDIRLKSGWDSLVDDSGHSVPYLITTATNGLIGAAYIATNNPAFVAAVTNCPVAIAASDAEALTEWGIYGGGGTIGALLAALAAAVAALKRGKVTAISAQSTDEQYPSAKCVWDIVGDVESALAAINGTANGGSGT